MKRMVRVRRTHRLRQCAPRGCAGHILAVCKQWQHAFQASTNIPLRVRHGAQDATGNARDPRGIILESKLGIRGGQGARARGIAR